MLLVTYFTLFFIFYFILLCLFYFVNIFYTLLFSIFYIFFYNHKNIFMRKKTSYYKSVLCSHILNQSTMNWNWIIIFKCLKEFMLVLFHFKYYIKLFIVLNNFAGVLENIYRRNNKLKIMVLTLSLNNARDIYNKYSCHFLRKITYYPH